MTSISISFKPNMTSESVSLYRLLRGMRAPNTHKRFVVHRLWIDADSCNRMMMNHAKLLLIQRIRPSCFNCKLFHCAKVLFNVIKQAFQLRCGQAARRSAADIAHPRHAAPFPVPFQHRLRFHETALLDTVQPDGRLRSRRKKTSSMHTALCKTEFLHINRRHAHGGQSVPAAR